MPMFAQPWSAYSRIYYIRCIYLLLLETGLIDKQGLPQKAVH